jgi:uncharacterized phage protein gp47/JayE
MPWSTPTLKQIRQNVRDAVAGSLPGADAMVPNSVLRVLSDIMGALCQLTLQYVDWLSLQLLPDTAETEWLDRHGDIWLVNADGTTGRKMATPSIGSALFNGTFGVVVPQGTILSYSTMEFQTMADITLSNTAVSGSILAMVPGVAGNLDPGTTLSISDSIVDASTTVVVDFLTGGTDEETDDELRARILQRIRQPPMGGDADDYVNWTLRVPGVTRAWCFPMEMGVGTCTVRFMMDDLRADNGGFPLPDDVDTVAAYLDKVRPVTVKDIFVESPIPYPINLRISWLDSDDASTRAAIEVSLEQQFLSMSIPGETWYRAWSDAAIMNASGVRAYDLTSQDTVMPSPGYMPTLGDLLYG